MGYRRICRPYPGRKHSGWLEMAENPDIYDQEYPKIVNADSHDAAMEEYDKMISEMNDAGLEDVEKVITQNYQERMKLWNE